MVLVNALRLQRWGKRSDDMLCISRVIINLLVSDRNHSFAFSRPLRYLKCLYRFALYWLSSRKQRLGIKP